MTHERKRRIVLSLTLLSIGVGCCLLIYSCAQPRLSSARSQPKRGPCAGDLSRLGMGSRKLALEAMPRGMEANVPRGAVALAPGEELWVIERSAEQASEPAPDEEAPGCGTLKAKLPNATEEVPMPLEHTDVHAAISAYIATVDVTQKYHNPYDEKIEAVYVFPLPQNAAVNEFLMTIGERRIRGIIREREEAEKIYIEARRQGYVASLLTQERPNIFTQKVANIEPGKRIDINIRYFHTLAYGDGVYEFVFPMVVGPRFNPPGMTDGVGAVARGAHGRSGQRTEVQYLAPHERSGHDIAVNVDIDAGVKIEGVTSPSHAIVATAQSPERITVALSPNDRIPNKDFVLRYTVAGKRIKSALLTHRDERGGYFTLMLFPPAELAQVSRAPMELIFVLDCSGSMSGQPIAKAKQAVARALRRLGPDDTFQIIRFSNNASQLGPKPIAATPKNVQRGLDYLASLNGGGGTMMIEGIKAALDFPHDPERLRVVSFMTDGYIGNDAQIIGEVHKRLGASRLFSFGVGSSPNRYLLDRMAILGRGAVAYVGLDESAGQAVDAFYERISHPAMTDIEIDWGGMRVSDVYPRGIPDLFVGRPVILTGRFEGQGKTTVRVTGKAGPRRPEIALAVDLDDASMAHTGLPSVWARMQISDLANQATHGDNAELGRRIRQVALEYGLMSAYTSFVAVDSASQTAGDHGTSVSVAVPVPEGVRYETTVAE
jgi:Ca-activated chloride channel family protein